MGKALSTQGTALMAQAKELVCEALRLHPGGRTATEIGRDTGLYLDVPKQKGYIAWTVLQRLVVEGAVVMDGRMYRLR